MNDTAMSHWPSATAKGALISHTLINGHGPYVKASYDLFLII